MKEGLNVSKNGFPYVKELLLVRKKYINRNIYFLIFTQPFDVSDYNFSPLNK